ncbi:uncharacterized protein HMPREF1541_03784 [Cyphellophora europaea CBS 101466]|uniref:Mid2 domain-containing protein n=1 Tax=Cyphellophora europaea (strain CBS 101466) TaxID=1220924 RepID=W2RZS3_CYPE1|nr:uncharacterized protein HMPREF1541_03784 [Cyphellophora europaea CBS 101466]ETN41845.1 hypothetical protein HMPREF1541_03784 [Cyphellophora europaea CBS 101466]
MASLFTETITAMSAVFTPPADCANSWTYEDEYYNSVEGGLLIQNMDSTSRDTSCFPTGFSGNGRAPSSIQVYSPGACPEGYQTPGQFQNDGTTTAICCPSSFSYGSTYSTINFYSDSSVLFMGCVSAFSGTTTVSARGNDTEIEVSGDISMWAQPITIEYRERDLSLFGSDTTSAGTSEPTTGSTIRTTDLPAPTAPASTTTTDGGGSSPSEEAQDSGLSTGAVAGIAVAACVVGLALITGLVFFIWRKRRAARGRKDNGLSAYNAQDSKEPYRQPHDWERRELDGSQAAEYRPELDGAAIAARGNSGIRQRPGEVSELE